MVQGSFVWADASASTTATPMIGKGKAKNERPSVLHRAIFKLRAAKKGLEKITDSYDGHRAKAIVAIDQALAELNQAVELNNN